jgi:predicted ATP-grasp superfamily ATP-dependent carboligase
MCSLAMPTMLKRKYDRQNYQIPAIVCDAEKLSQVAIIQDLGRLGIPLIAVSNKKEAMGFASRYIEKKIVCEIPSYEDEYALFLIRSLPRGVIFYSNDANAENIAKNKNNLLKEGFGLLISDSSILERVIEKDNLYSTGLECSVRVPKSFLVSSCSNLVEVASKVGFPLILKATNLAGGVYRLAKHARELDIIFEEMRKTVNSEIWRHRKARLIAQEWIPQENIKLWNFNACVEGGEIISYSMGERIRTNIFPDGTVGSTLMYGVSKYNESILEENRKILKHLKYDGIVETEWSENVIYPEMTYLYDFNPRPSGNIRWVFQSGVSFVEDYYRVCLGLPLSNRSEMKEGVKYFKMFYHDNDFLKAVENPRLSLRKKMSVLKEDIIGLWSYRRHAIDVFDVKDLGPTVIASRSLPILFLKGIIRLILGCVYQKPLKQI